MLWGGVGEFSGRTARSTCGLMILMHELDDLHGLNPGNSLSCLPTSDPATSLSLAREQQHAWSTCSYTHVSCTDGAVVPGSCSWPVQ